MLLRALILATGGLLLALLVVVVVQIFKIQLSWWRFKRETNGLPIITEGRSIFCNHTIGWCLRKNSLNDLRKYNETHGKPKTVGWMLGTKYAACTIDLDLMKRIVLDEPNKNVNRIHMDVPMAEYMEDNILTAPDDQWRRLRRAVAPALRSSRFKAPNVLEEIEASISKLIEAIEFRLDEKTSAGTEGGAKRLEVDELMHRYSLNLVFSCFYKQYDLIDFNSEHCEWTSRVDEGLEAMIKSPMIKLGIMIEPLRQVIDWLIWNFHPQGEWRRKIVGFIRLQLNQSLKAREHLRRLKSRAPHAVETINKDDFQLDDGTRFKRNMADHITDHLLDGKISEREFINTSSFLLGAADKTAADGLVHVIYQLSIDQAVQTRARTAVQREGAEAEYLDWVVNESLRLMPPAPVSCSRAIAEPMEIEGGFRLPAGTFVSFPNYLIHRLKEYWGEDAEEFKPERWADTSKHHPMQYVPFGAGLRKCPGREFALFEMKELLTRLLLRYKFSGQPKADAYTFDSPYMIFLLFNSPTYISIERL